MNRILKNSLAGNMQRYYQGRKRIRGRSNVFTAMKKAMLRTNVLNWRRKKRERNNETKN